MRKLIYVSDGKTLDRYNRKFAKFTLEDYNNKKVVGLHDEQAERFYIIKKVG